MSESHGKITAADGHVYHKSKSANATVAPTNQATIDKAQGKGVDPNKLQFVTIVDYEWNLNAELNPKKLCDEYGFTPEEVSGYLAEEEVILALEERGITRKLIQGITTLASSTKTAKLTPIQLVAANKIMDLSDTKSDRKKLQDLGVTSLQYTAWMRDPEFRSYLQSRAESLVGDNQHEAMLALMDKVKSRDLNSIKYYHALTGRFVEQKSNDAQGTTQNSLEVMVVRIIEIIIDEVDDPELAARIGDRLKALVTGAQIAGIISSPVGDSVVVPEVAEAREITPAVKALMEQGVGYDG